MRLVVTSANRYDGRRKDVVPDVIAVEGGGWDGDDDERLLQHSALWEE